MCEVFEGGDFSRHARQLNVMIVLQVVNISTLGKAYNVCRV